jgi:hypothetical protein
MKKFFLKNSKVLKYGTTIFEQKIANKRIFLALIYHREVQDVMTYYWIPTNLTEMWIMRKYSVQIWTQVVAVWDFTKWPFHSKTVTMKEFLI